MMPMTSSAACALWYSLCSRTTSPQLTVASGSLTQVDMLSTAWTPVGSSVATDLQIDSPPPRASKKTPPRRVYNRLGSGGVSILLSHR